MGDVIVSWAPSGAPKPAGLNTSVCESGSLQLPGGVGGQRRMVAAEHFRDRLGERQVDAAAGVIVLDGDG